jgi:AcrR family transcriptional regulator
MPSTDRQAGAETRAEILRVALRLFTEKGYEGTSTRDISSALGMTKSSLYYHFRNKEEIVASLLAERRHDLDALIEWITPDLAQRAASRGGRLRSGGVPLAPAPRSRRNTAPRNGPNVRILRPPALFRSRTRHT